MATDSAVKLYSNKKEQTVYENLAGKQAPLAISSATACSAVPKGL